MAPRASGGSGTRQLRRVSTLFEGLSEAEVAALVAELPRRQVARGTYLLRAGDSADCHSSPASSAYLILDGMVKIYGPSEDGKLVLLALAGPGELVGEMGAIERAAPSADVVALDRCTVLPIPQHTLRSWIRSPILAANLMRLLSRRLRSTSAQVRVLITLDVYKRVARQLLSLAADYGVDLQGRRTLPFALTQEDLAAMVGAERPTVSTVINAFKDQGLIEVGAGRRIAILDPARLAVARKPPPDTR